MSRNGKSLAYYITPHGFGHGVRSCEIIRVLTEMRPDLDITVVSTLPEWLLEKNIGRRLEIRPVFLDLGLYQLDSVRSDLARTLEALHGLMERSSEIVEAEKEFLERKNVGTVVSDVAFLPFEAARSCGIPSIGISNFTWDWIYSGYETLDPAWKEIVAWARDYYGRCALFLQLPMHGDCSACPVIEDIPLVARKAQKGRREVRRALGIDPDRKAFLVSFTSLRLESRAWERLRSIEDVLLLYSAPLELPLPNARSFDNGGIRYVDVVGAVDGVITKPGYGIVSDCLANGTPIIYTERGGFLEYPYLVEEIERNLSAVFIPAGEFGEGEWESAIRKIDALPPRSPAMRLDGAEVAARKILQVVENGTAVIG
ncbi:MAG: hypothetical protein LLG06_08260 [Desulfobacteraceae bacterium]|nr:hypothetical protein [Desulfobacteraceae bacterium]